MKRCVWFLLACVLTLSVSETCRAGMPALLPTNWTADKSAPTWAHVARESGDAQWQAISFFAAGLLASAWGVKALWNSLRGEFVSLPRLSYRRSLNLVVLWGLCFVVVLTMISGARELMTPGAWKKQGWTYTLADTPHNEQSERRRHTLEQLRNALWHYAATHEGKFPSEGESSIDPKLWEIPNWGRLRFMYISGLSADQSGRLLAFEPELDSDERFVLLTNGFLGTMRTTEIERLMEGAASP